MPRWSSVAHKRKQLILLLLWLATLTLALPPRRREPRHGARALRCRDVGHCAGVSAAKAVDPNGATWDGPRAILAGLIAAVGCGWLWTGAVSYIPTSGWTRAPSSPTTNSANWRLQVRQRADDGDTLFVLPETDSTPQLHPLTGMIPPGDLGQGLALVFQAGARSWRRSSAEWDTMRRLPGSSYFPTWCAAGEPGIRGFCSIIVAGALFASFSNQLRFSTMAKQQWLSSAAAARIGFQNAPPQPPFPSLLGARGPRDGVAHRPPGAGVDDTTVAARQARPTSLLGLIVALLLLYAVGFLACGAEAATFQTANRSGFEQDPDRANCRPRLPA